MIKIRAMGARELKQVLLLLERFAEKDFEYRVLETLRHLYGPLQRMSQMLPPRWQFLPAIYVAVSKNKVLGLIWLVRDGQRGTRWKIEQLVIDPDEFSYDVGTQLVHYVVNRYGAEGVQTFLALVHHQYEQALGLLKSCGFRHLTRIHAAILEDPSSSLAGAAASAIIDGLRESSDPDCHKLKVLYDESVPVEKRAPLEKSPSDFSRPLLGALVDRLKGIFFKRWVVPDPLHEGLVGSVAVTTENYRDFQVEIVVSPAWEEGFEALLRFAVRQSLGQNRNVRILLQTYDFHKTHLETLRKLGFKRVHEAELLVKDYWVPLEDRPHRLRSPVLLFAGKTSTACSGRLALR